MYTPARPSVGKYTHRTTVPCPSGARGVGRARRPTDRPVRGGAVPAVENADDDDPTSRRHRATRAPASAREHAMKKTSAPDRGTTVAVVRAEGSDVDGKTTGLVRPRRMRRDAMRRPRAMIAARVCGGSARWGKASTRANAGAR